MIVLSSVMPIMFLGKTLQMYALRQATLIQKEESGMKRKMKTTEINAVKDMLLEKQGYKCAICSADFKEAYYHHTKKKRVPKHTPCLDHDHKTGQVRGVLCSGCNSVEGKYINAIERWHTNVHIADTTEVYIMTQQLAYYYSKHRDDELKLIHPSFRNEEEKRLWKNKKARMKRYKMKQTT